MSGGMKISDKGGYAGTSDAMMGSKTHLKKFSSAMDAGGESSYEDTTEAIKRVQDMNASKAKSRPMKDGYRN